MGGIFVSIMSVLSLIFLFWKYDFLYSSGIIWGLISISIGNRYSNVMLIITTINYCVIIIGIILSFFRWILEFIKLKYLPNETNDQEEQDTRIERLDSQIDNMDNSMENPDDSIENE